MRTLPEASFFVPPAAKQRAWERRIDAAAEKAPSVLHLTHASCLDGAASDLFVRMDSGNAEVRTLWLEPHATLDALDRVAEVAGRGRRLVVTDLSLQKGQAERLVAVLGALTTGGWRVEWRDHHARQWDGAPLDALCDQMDLTLDLDGKECGASLLARDLGLAEPFVDRLVAAVRDHDLWLQKDPFGHTLNDAVRGLGSERFVETLLRTRDPASPELLAAAAEAADARKRTAAEAIASARLVVAGNAVVGVVYGDAPTNDVLHALYTDKGADVGILLKPEGTFSLRSRKGVEVCTTVAQAFGGGGHPNAAGGTLALKGPSLALFWAMRDHHPRARALVDATLRAVAAVKTPASSSSSAASPSSPP